jgi:hypothetical protein
LEVTAVHFGEIEDDTYIFLTIAGIWLTYNLHFIYRAWIARVTERDLRRQGLDNASEHNQAESLSKSIRNEDKRKAASLTIPSSRRTQPQKIENPILKLLGAVQ